MCSPVAATAGRGAVQADCRRLRDAAGADACEHARRPRGAAEARKAARTAEAAPPPAEQRRRRAAAFACVLGRVPRRLRERTLRPWIRQVGDLYLAHSSFLAEWDARGLNVATLTRVLSRKLAFLELKSRLRHDDTEERIS